jgi:hypothetical protein
MQNRLPQFVPGLPRIRVTSMQIRNRIHLFISMRTWIRGLFIFYFYVDPDLASLLIKVMRFSDHWTTDPPGLHLSLHASTSSVHGPLRLHFEPIKLLNFYFTDSEAAYHLNPGLYISTLEDEKLKPVSTVVQVGRAAGRQGG